MNSVSIENGGSSQKLFESRKNTNTKQSIKTINSLTNSDKEIFYDMYDRPIIIKSI